MHTQRRRRILLAACTAVAGLTTAACAGTSGSNLPPIDPPRELSTLRGTPVVLTKADDCDEVLDDLQSMAPAAFDVRRGGAGWQAEDRVLAAELDAAPAAEGANNTAAPEPAATSSTNTQEAGIDEPDTVETDGRHVFVVDGTHLVVLDAADASVVGRLELATHGAGILLQGDRILAVSGGAHHGGRFPMPVEMPAPMPAVEVDAVGEPVLFAGGVVLELIDVSDRTAPVIVETTELEGWHVATRVVDGDARVVITSPGGPRPLAGVDVGENVEDVIAASRVDDWLPRYRNTSASGTSIQGSAVECSSVLVPEVEAGISQTSVVRVDFADGFDPADTTTVVADASTVYASATTLYLTASALIGVDEQGRVDPDEFGTAVHAFDLQGDGPAVHVAAGSVPGHVLNQYSLSEYDGHLRIATTEGSPWGRSADSESGVRVLLSENGTLREVGAVTGLGRTETIQSVRFLGDVGYVVTFRQIDPLYVIDLSDPTSPRAVGELKIPGFSSYLHPTGPGRVIGIGRDADLDGRDRGLLVSLFDVSDPTDPVQLRTYTEPDAWSAAGADPKTFLHWAPEQAIVIPIERHAGFDAAGGQTTESGTGIAVLDVDDSGITERGTVTLDGHHPRRALVVDGRLWSVFQGAVVVTDFTSLGNGTVSRW